jgi:hypothetical protein
MRFEELYLASRGRIFEDSQNDLFSLSLSTDLMRLAMRRTFGLVAVLLSLGLVLPTSAADKNNKKDAPKSDLNEATAQDYKSLGSTLVGKIDSVSADQSIMLRVEYEVAEPNPNYKPPRNSGVRPITAKTPQELARQLQQQAIQLQKEEAQYLKNAFKMVTEHKDYSFKSTDKVVVRLQDLPMEFDEKGFPKKYTPDELKQLKGPDPKQPGYAADFDKLKAGQTVRLTLVKPKVDKDADEVDRRPQISLIMILADAPDTATPSKGGKGKK